MDANGGLSLPLYGRGSESHAWLGMFMGVVIDATVFVSLLFTLIYLWTGSAGSASPLMLELSPAASGALLLALGSWGLARADRLLAAGRRSAFRLSLVLAVLVVLAALLYLGNVFADAGVDPRGNAVGAAIWAIAGYHLIHLGIVLLMGLYALARSLAGRLTREHDADMKNISLFWHYTSVQGAVAVAVLYLMPV